MNAVARTNEQAVVQARTQIAALKDKYLQALTALVRAKTDTNPFPPLILMLECQQMGNSYFNYVETFVGDSGLLGAHDNGIWVTGFAEDCSAILGTIVNHFQFLRSYANDYKELKSKIEPDQTAFANMQRLVAEYLGSETAKKLQQLFIENNLPVTGFNVPAAENVSKTSKAQVVAGFVVGIVLLLVSVGIAVALPSPSAWQQFVFRGMLAISIALMAPMIPGFVNFTSKFAGKGAYAKVVAGGSIAIFVIIWLLNPPTL